MEDTTIMDPREALRIRLGTLGWALLAIVFLLGGAVLLTASPLVLLVAVVLGLIIGGVAFLIHRLLRRHPPRPGRGAFLRAAAASIALVMGAGAAPIYWYALALALDPLAVPRATLTNGAKQVVFQGMIHVGSDSFNRSVTYDMIRAREGGFVMSFEGVETGTPEAEAWLNSPMVSGSGDINAGYQEFSDPWGLQFQGTYLQFLQDDAATHPERSVMADVSTSQMYEEYQRLVAADPGFADRVAAARGADDEAKDATSDGDDGGVLELGVGFLSRLDDGQRGLVAEVCQGYFTRLLNRPGQPDPLDPVILDFRNRELARRIVESPDDRIYVVYGADHLPGLLADLQANDAAWIIGAVSWTTAIAPADDATGTL